MADDDGERRAWLVERAFGDEDLVTLVYATPDGEWAHRRQRATTILMQKPTTAAIEVDADELTPVEDEDLRERYGREAERMIERYDPDEQV